MKTIKKWQLNLRPRNVITHKFDIKELESCKMYDSQINYCIKSLHLLSSGSSRLAFEYNDTVVKVAKLPSGMLANYYEVKQVNLCPELFPEVVYAHQAKTERYDFIIVEKVIPFDNQLMKDKVGIVWEELYSLLIWNCMKDVTDRKIRMAWHNNYYTYLRCSITHIKKLNEKFMTTKNAVHDFIDNVMNYCASFDFALHPNVVSDFKIQNLGWSEKTNAIVVLDNGSDVHVNAIWNNVFVNKKQRKAQRLYDLIEGNKITSKQILESRKNK